MPIATLTNIEKTFGERVLFDRLNLNIYRGERIGLIGANGSGKTSLFKTLLGQLIPDEGTAAISKSIKVGHLKQDPTFDPENTVMDEAELAFADLHRVSHRLRDLEHEMAGETGETLERTLRQYQNLQHEFEAAGGYAWRHKLEATLSGVGLEQTCWEQNVETLSGGQRSRLALAKLLISEPELLLLDEPTNHLDLAAIDWLERYLLDYSGAVVLISHDRYLLDRLATRIVWLTQCRLSSYRGNYSAFVQQRELQELSQQRQYAQQQADIEKQQEYIRRFKAGQRARQAKGRERRLGRLLQSDAMIAAVQKQNAIHLSLSTDQRAGDQVLRVSDLSKSYDGKRLWQSVAFEVRRGQRLGLIGPNGSGKTTLMEVLLGMRDADSGNIKWGANLNIGYYDQRLDDFDLDNTVMEEVSEGRGDGHHQEIRDLLAMLLFRGEDVDKPIRLLSGGERARVRLAELLLDKPNVLLLDEPTNHLDIASREALETALSAFEGTILCVSHDRYFLDKIAQRLLVIRPPDVIDFTGNYTAWTKKQTELAQAREAAKSAQPKTSSQSPDNQKSRIKNQKSDNPYLRPFGRLSIEELEQQIMDTEIAVAECQSAFASPESFKDLSQGQRLQTDYQALSAKLEQLEAEYFAREQ